MRGVIAMTWDDGYKTDMSVAMQAQVDRGMTPKGTTFVIGSMTGPTRLTPAEKVGLVDSGWDLQCHSYTHPVGVGGLTGLTAAQLHDEMRNNNAHFASLGLPAPEFMAYPGNAHNKLVRDVCGRYRKMARSDAGMFITRRTPKMYLPTFGFDNIATPAAFDSALAHITLAAKHDYVMTTMMHEFDTPEKIAAYGLLLDHIIRLKIRMVTITELYRLLS